MKKQQNVKAVINVLQLPIEESIFSDIKQTFDLR